MLELTEERQTFVFEAIGSTPVLSLLRGFSAPVKIDMELNDATLQLQLTPLRPPTTRTAALLATERSLGRTAASCGSSRRTWAALHRDLAHAHAHSHEQLRE